MMTVDSEQVGQFIKIQLSAFDINFQSALRFFFCVAAETV